jgi:hypothetical protein
MNTIKPPAVPLQLDLFVRPEACTIVICAQDVNHCDTRLRTHIDFVLPSL